MKGMKMSANTNIGTSSSKRKKYTRYASLEAVEFGNWLIKASSADAGGILVIMYNTKTYQACTKYFSDEYQANIFITYAMEKYQ